MVILLKKTTLSLVLILSVVLLSSCGSGQSIEQVVASPEPTPSKYVDLEAKERIKNLVLGYTDFNCTPKYVTEVNNLGDGIILRSKEMYVFNEKIALAPMFSPDNIYAREHVLADDPSDSSYGNLAIRATYLASAYHYNLSGLYTYIYDIHDSELKSLRTDYTRFKTLADRAGKKLCPIVKKFIDTEALDAPEANKVQDIYDELVASWDGFRNWWAAAWAFEQIVAEGIEQDIRDFNTPTCEEFPAKDGKYVVVKCTMP